MKKLWLVTGATGHVGGILVSVLRQRGEHVRALVRSDSKAFVHADVEICKGDIRNRESLVPFFDRGDYDCVSLVHCAALITIASKHNPEVWNINVHGTDNVMSLARDTGVERYNRDTCIHCCLECVKDRCRQHSARLLQIERPRFMQDGASRIGVSRELIGFRCPRNPWHIPVCCCSFCIFQCVQANPPDGFFLQ